MKEEERQRQGDGRDQRVGRAPEEQEDDEHDQDEGDQERRLHVADRVDIDCERS